ncbi:MAG TPA: hypothetical protein VLS89_07915 [Candidatus Nanopelagicales bacterium]|nr:hypothetical protein [Candidatus Nanopelagicales bacterium]
MVSASEDVQQGSNSAYRASLPRSESERLLALAESLLEKREQTLMSIKKYESRSTFGSLFSFIVALSVGVYFGEFSMNSSPMKGLILGVLVLFAGIVLFQIPSVVSGKSSDLAALRASLRRDERALFEVVAILRESQGGLSETEHWSTLQQAEFRIRLARFDIGTESSQVHQIGLK